MKTRLAAELGQVAALEIYRELGVRTVSALRRVRDCRVLVLHTPDDRGDALGPWLGETLDRRPQGSGDLGIRMARAIESALADGARRVIVVGTDCPSLSAELVEAAFAALDSTDIVLGPAIDGGYYLIGMRRLEPSLFENVPWSSADTLAVTLARARAQELSVALMPELRDIDTADDWRAWRAAQLVDPEEPER